MPTLSTPKYSKGGSRAAFTLIELVIVIFIISLSAALIMPNLWETGEGALKAEAERLGNTLRYIYDEATGKKLTYTLTIDLNENEWGFESENETRAFRARDNIEISDVVIPSLGTITAGEAILLFGPLGPEEPLTLHLASGGFEYTVAFNHLNGRARIYEGYRK